MHQGQEVGREVQERVQMSRALLLEREHSAKYRACVKICSLASLPGELRIFYLTYFYFFYFIRVRLIYNVVLVSGVQQSDSVIHIFIVFEILFSYRLSQQSIQSVEFPVLYSRSMLVIYLIYSSVYKSIPSS